MFGPQAKRRFAEAGRSVREGLASFLKPMQDHPGARVLFLTHEFPPFRGGVATYVREAAEAARRLGLQVRVLAPDYHSLKTASDGSVERFSGGGRLNLRGIFEVATAVWHRRHELAGVPVVAMSAGAMMALMLLDRAALFRPTRLVCLFHGSEILKFATRPFWKRLAPGFFRRWGHAAVTSGYVQRLLEESRLRTLGWNLVVTHCACPAAFQARCVDQLLHAAPSDPETLPLVMRVLTVARLHPRKGQLEVARALAGLPDSLRSKIIYQMAGVGLSAYRQEVAAACRLGGVKAEFLGDVPDAALPELYWQSDVCAQASRSLTDSVEGFGITYLEAAAAGKPVIAYASGGTSEAVLDGQTGLLVPEGDFQALRNAFATLLLDSDHRLKLGEAGRSHAQRFHWEDAARTLWETAQTACPAS